MKTTLATFSTKLKRPLLCENQLSRPSSSLRWWQVRGQSLLKELIRRAQEIAGHAFRDLRAGLNALLLSIGANNRIYVGLVFMGVVAPLSSCFYLLFDKDAVDKTWYYVSYYWLFFSLASSLFIASCLIGVWFLFPVGSKRAYTLIVPAGYTAGKILWTIQVTTNAEYHSMVPSSFVLLGILITLFLFVALDWLAHNKFHRADAFKARMDKLCELADEFDDAKFKSMVKSVYREKKAFQKSF